jgi:hypothetical protein
LTTDQHLQPAFCLREIVPAQGLERSSEIVGRCGFPRPAPQEIVWGRWPNRRLAERPRARQVWEPSPRPAALTEQARATGLPDEHGASNQQHDRSSGTRKLPQSIARMRVEALAPA